MSSGWFGSTELPLTTALQGKPGVEGADALVWGGSSTSNLLAPFRTTCLQSWQGVSRSFTCVWGGRLYRTCSPPRTFSNKSLSETARCVEFFNSKGVVPDELCEREFRTKPTVHRSKDVGRTIGLGCTLPLHTPLFFCYCT